MKVSKKGISLIVLVITIIILAILAATVIITITNSGLINSSKDAVGKYDLAQVRDMASLAWAEALVDDSITSDAEYKAYVKESLENSGVDTTKYDIKVTAGGFTVDELDTDEDEYVDLIITADMEGVTFTKANGDPGDPNNLETGDKVIYGDYMYVYNQRRVIGESANRPFFTHINDTSMNGWSCTVTDNTKSEYGKIATSVMGSPVTNIDNLFSYFSNGDFYGSPIINAPVIPSGITSMEYAFAYCEPLSGTIKIYAENVDNVIHAINHDGGSIIIQVPEDSITYSTVYEFFKNNSNIQFDNVTIETF